MRHLFTIFALGLVSSLVGLPAASQERNEGVDLLGKNLKEWSRTGTGKSRWGLTPDGILMSDGTADTFVYSNTLGDGTLTLQWRFLPSSAKRTGHSAYLTVRGGEGEFVTRIGLGDDCGTLSTTVLGSRDKVKMITTPTTKNHAKKIGEWNTMKVVMKGKEIKVVVNGEEANFTADAANETGFISLSAAGYPVEFRTVLWKEER